MPLRDHFRPPVTKTASWEALNGQWPANIVKQLRTTLPPGFIAAPTVHAGAQVEIDMAAYERTEELPSSPAGNNGGVATAVWIAEPVVNIETELPEYDKYEVRIYDVTSSRRLVAAVELVSPANKDREEARNAFVGKCAALLQEGVAVSIIDLVTPRHLNLYAELMEFVGQADPTMSTATPYLYAASCRWLRREPKALLQTWSHTLAVGQPLPALPLWLAEKLVVPLDLEQSYEQTCHDLWIA